MHSLSDVFAETALTLLSVNVLPQEARNPDRPDVFGGPALVKEDDRAAPRGKRISSPERWEITQLVASGVLDKSELPTFDEEQGMLNTEETEEDMEVEIIEDEPPFLEYVPRVEASIALCGRC